MRAFFLATVGGDCYSSSRDTVLVSIVYDLGRIEILARLQIRSEADELCHRPRERRCRASTLSGL